MTSSMRIIVFLLLASIVASTEASVSCDTVLGNLYPCHPYAAVGGNILSTCCNGIKMLSELSKSVADRKAICGCIKSSFGDMHYEDFPALPGKCGLTFNIDPSTDCNSLSMTCEMAKDKMKPCFEQGNEPTNACCYAIYTLNRHSTTTQARRDLCKCFQDAVRSPPFIQLTGFPEQCHISRAVPFQPNLDCGRFF